MTPRFIPKALLQALVLSGIFVASGFGQGVGVRQIVVASEADAVELARAVADGRPFDVVAGERSQDPASASRGGYIGRMVLADLRSEFRVAVEGLAPGDVSAPVRIGGEWYLFQTVSDAESDWLDLDDAGVLALARDRYAEAAALFERALDQAGVYAPDSPQVVRSLDRLALAYRFLERPAEAEALYGRALELAGMLDVGPLESSGLTNGLATAMLAQGKYDEAERYFDQARVERESILGADHPDAAAIRFNIADVHAARGEFLEAGAVYDEALGIIEGALGPAHPATQAGIERRTAFRQSLVPVLLDRLSTVVALAEFKDGAFQDTLREIEALLPLAPLTELAYVQMKDVLLGVGLGTETEMVLRRGLDAFDDSRLLRIYLADLMAGTGRTADALVVLQEAAALPRPEGLDAATDRQHQAIIDQRLGDIRSALNDVEGARAAFERSIAIDPNVPGGWTRLGDIALNGNRVADALSAYQRAAAANPDDPAAHLNLAEGYSADGRWAESAAAARRAIESGTADSRALYLLGTALIRLGERDAGQEQLREFQDREAATRDREQEDREVDAISFRAVGLLRDGEGDVALQALREGIATYPSAGRLYMNLAMVESRLGRHTEAIATYERMIDLGVGRPFLVHRNLAEEYSAIGDAESSANHRDTYVERRQSELILYQPE